MGRHRCSHPSSAWGEWVHDSTNPDGTQVWIRTKMCSRCGEDIERQIKQV